jgi:hypothetical protein
MTRRKTILTICLAMLLCLGGSGRLPGADPRPAPKEEPLMVIINRKNPIDNLTFEELRNLCLVQRRHWPEGGKVTIVLREPANPERDAVLGQIYRMSENEFRRYFLQSSFTGEVQSTPKELATGTGVRRFVFNVPGAIGFVRAGDVDDSVKVITVDGRKAADPHYRLKVPTH